MHLHRTCEEQNLTAGGGSRYFMWPPFDAWASAKDACPAQLQ